MIVHEVFPVLVCEFHYDEHEGFKNVFYQHMKDWVDPKGHQDESGTQALHQEKELLPFYSFVAQSAKQYIHQLGLDSDDYYYNIVKSWWNINHRDSIPPHAHSDAHLSFSYYLNAPPDSNRLVFIPDHRFQNDLTHGMFLEDYNGDSPIINTNRFNSSPTFVPEDGMLVMFPGSLAHQTIPADVLEGNDVELKPDPATTDEDEIKRRRISIAGDILLTLRDNGKPRAMGLRSSDHWIRFK